MLAPFGIRTMRWASPVSTSSGLFGAFIIRDPAEQALNLPGGAFDIPHRALRPHLDREGSCCIRSSRLRNAPFRVGVLRERPIVCNGKIFPYLEVQPRRTGSGC